MRLIETPKDPELTEIHNQSWSSAADSKGKRIRVRFSQADKELSGFPLLYLGLEVWMTIQYDASASGMSGAMAGERLLLALDSLTLKMGKHHFITDLNGWELHQHYTRLAGRGDAEVPADVADGDATDATVTVKVFIPFQSPRQVEGAEYDGCISAALFRDDDLEIGILSGTSLGHAGVTYDGITNLRVYAVQKSHHQLRIPTAWEVRRYTTTELDYSFEPSGFIYYADVFHPELSEDVSNYGDTTVVIGDGRLRKHTVAELVRADRRSILARHPYPDLQSETSPRYLPIVGAPLGDLMTRQPRGRVRIKHDSVPGASTTVQYFGRGTRTAEYQDEVLRRLDIPTDAAARAQLGVRAEARAARGGGVPEWLLPHLDASIRWPNMPFAAIAGNAALRAG